MSNRSQYKAMMEGVHAPADLLARAKGIPMEKKSTQRTMTMRIAAATCAAVLGVFAVTNGVCYAATGETWVEKVTVFVNGQEQEVDMTFSQEGDATVAEMTVETDEGGSLVVSVDGDMVKSDGYQLSVNEGASGSFQVHGDDGASVLEGEDGTVLLAVDGVDPIDITSQLAHSGIAKGSFEKNGETYSYEVSGQSGNYNVNLGVGNSAAEL